MPFVRRRAAAIAAATLCAGSAAAQSTFTDMEGRFALDLPKGWQIQNQQTDIWTFGRSGAPMIIVQFVRGAADRQAAFDQATMVMLQANGYAMPPADSLRDLEINGNAARRAIFPLSVTAGANTVVLTTFLGSAVLEGGEGAVTFASFAGPQHGKYLAELGTAFESIRLPGAKVSGARNLRVATLTLRDTASRSFSHALVQATVPPGWTVEPGSGMILGNLTHPAYGRISLMGTANEDLGKDVPTILAGLQQGLQTTLGSMTPVGPAYDVVTNSGATMRALDFTGVITAGGANVAQRVTVAGFKDPARSLGVMAFYPASAAAVAKADVLAVIRSLR